MLWALQIMLKNKLLMHLTDQIATHGWSPQETPERLPICDELRAYTTTSVRAPGLPAVSQELSEPSESLVWWVESVAARDFCI